MGESVDVKSRIEQHNTGYYAKSFTSSTNDWVLFVEIICDSKGQALKIESHIKKMKSKNYIQNLKRYPELVLKLKEQYN